VATKYGETEMSAYLLPISVDGLIVVASVSLVELAGRVRFLEEQREQVRAAPAAAAPPPVPAPAPPVAAPAPAYQAPAPVHQEPVGPAARPMHTHALADGGSVSTARAVNSAVVPSEPVSMGPRTPVSPLSGKPLTQTGTHAIIPQRQPAQNQPTQNQPSQSQPTQSQPTQSQPTQSQPAQNQPAAAPVSPAVAPAKPVYVNGSTPTQRPSVTRAAVSTSPRTMVTAPTTRPAESTTPRQRRPVQETAELAAEIEAMHPEISHTELARRLGISATRLRAVRREAREVRRSGATRN
jgi:hypothetical protein